MRSMSIRVKKPSWVRIVNPDPITILGMTWRYGSHVRIAPDGVFYTIAGGGARMLAMYQPPHAPSQQDDAPPDALVLYSIDDLRLLAEGKISFDEPYEPSVATWGLGGPAKTVRYGDRAGIPRSRGVRALFPPVTREFDGGGIYRERREVEIVRERRPERSVIRPGGVMTVMPADGPVPSNKLKVRYTANPAWIGEQCETGAWFYITEDEFLRMKDDAARIEELESLERAIVESMLRSL